MPHSRIPSLRLLLVGALASQSLAAEEPQTDSDDNRILLPAIRIWGERQSASESGHASPISSLKPEDLAAINLATTEDSVKHEPGVAIRRRFIGDANGTLGIRGANMFQTSRSMVFADGVPLHYFLETRWNGAPRWTMVSASEIASVDVIYGPFSAEYGGNAMGGVVLIETAIPQYRQFHFDGMLYSQQFDAYGFDDNVDGFKGFMSYGDRIDDLSLYFSWNHLQNESQPQSFYRNTSGAGGSEVTGGLQGNDQFGVRQIYFGDSGVIDTATDNFKFKAGYDLGDWSALLNIAYEDRLATADQANSYIRDAGTGETLWGGNVTQGGDDFSIGAGNLKESEQLRDSLNVGLRLKGELSDSLRLETSLSRFDVLRDETRESAVNPDHPSYTPAGQVKAYDDTGWKTAETKLFFDHLGSDTLSLVTGVRHEHYAMNVSGYDSSDYAAGRKDNLTSNSGGKTRLSALFAQLRWEFARQWDAAFGARHESWRSHDGYFYDRDNDVFVLVPNREEQRFSPKFSLGFRADQGQLVRYSIARAYRFPIVEELFNQHQSYTSQNVANPGLKPEAGLHHNLMFEQALRRGYFRINLFHENIRDVIEAQSEAVADGEGNNVTVRSFIPVDEVETSGIDVALNQNDFILDRLDVRFNLTYTDSTIIRNDADPSLEGKRYPRMPYWRGNVLANYRLTPAWHVGGSVQYASSSYGSLDNSDRERQVMGAQDAYTRVGVKTRYWLDDHASVSFGIDNLGNEIAYVAHPWPGRTFYLAVSYDL